MGPLWWVVRKLGFIPGTGDPLQVFGERGAAGLYFPKDDARWWGVRASWGPSLVHGPGLGVGVSSPEQGGEQMGLAAERDGGLGGEKD